MASLTPTINPTGINTRNVEGMLKFSLNPNISETVSFTEKVGNSLNTYLIEEPELSNGEIYLNSVNFYENNKHRLTTLEDYEYYDTLDIRVQEQSSPRTYYDDIPRTDYLEKTFTASDSATILTFRNSIIKELYSEIDVKIVDSSGYYLEPVNVSVVDEYCTVTIPITSRDGKCRIYVYNPIDYSDGNLKFNKSYTTGSESLMPMDYRQWLELTCKKFITLVKENDSSTDRYSLANRFESNLSSILDTVITHIGIIPAVGLYIAFNGTTELNINITALDVDTPQTVTISSYDNTVGDGLGYYNLSAISAQSPTNNVICSVTSSSVSYSYDTNARTASKIGYGITLSSNVYGVSDSCNLGTHIG